MVDLIEKKIRAEERAHVKVRRDRRRQELRAEADRARQDAERKAAKVAADKREADFRKADTPSCTFVFGNRVVRVTLGHPDPAVRLTGVEACARLARRIALTFQD